MRPAGAREMLGRFHWARHRPDAAWRSDGELGLYQMVEPDRLVLHGLGVKQLRTAQDREEVRLTIWVLDRQQRRAEQSGGGAPAEVRPYLLALALAVRLALGPPPHPAHPPPLGTGKQPFHLHTVSDGRGPSTDLWVAGSGGGAEPDAILVGAGWKVVARGSDWKGEGQAPGIATVGHLVDLTRAVAEALVNQVPELAPGPEPSPDEVRAAIDAADLATRWEAT